MVQLVDIFSKVFNSFSKSQLLLTIYTSQPEMALMAGVMEHFLSHGLEHQPESLHYDVATCIGQYRPLIVRYRSRDPRPLIGCLYRSVGL